ncbi:unnamed protein product, partial [Rotaria magnacalcarata]
IIMLLTDSDVDLFDTTGGRIGANDSSMKQKRKNISTYCDYTAIDITH